jgi:hypothetical protein
MKAHHAIAYTSSSEPLSQMDEMPTSTESGPMLPGIRIVPKHKGDKLDRMSRVDFSRIYTVMHDNEVYYFGVVHSSHLSRLHQQWIRVIANNRSIVPRLGLEEGVRGGSDEDSDEDSDDE